MELLETASDIDLNYPDEDGRTPLLLAALHDRAAAARFLWSGARTPRPSGAGPGRRTGRSRRRGARHVATMDALLEVARPPTATGPDGRTPLIAAAEAGIKSRRPAPVRGAAVDSRQPTARRRRARRRRAATAMF